MISDDGLTLHNLNLLLHTLASSLHICVVKTPNLGNDFSLPTCNSHKIFTIGLCPSHDSLTHEHQYCFIMDNNYSSIKFHPFIATHHLESILLSYHLQNW